MENVLRMMSDAMSTRHLAKNYLFIRRHNFAGFASESTLSRPGFFDPPLLRILPVSGDIEVAQDKKWPQAVFEGEIHPTLFRAGDFESLERGQPLEIV